MFGRNGYGPTPNKHATRGHGGGSRIRFHTGNTFSEPASILGQYEWGMDFARAPGMHGPAGTRYGAEYHYRTATAPDRALITR